MHVIMMPPPVEITVIKKLITGEQLERSEIVTFPKWLVYVCEGYQKFAKGPKQARQYDKLMGIIERIKPKAKTVAFEAGDYEILGGAMVAPEWASPEINRQYIPFYDAFENAEVVETPQDTRSGKKKKKG